jgi:hypothetical protein
MSGGSSQTELAEVAGELAAAREALGQRDFRLRKLERRLDEGHQEQKALRRAVQHLTAQLQVSCPKDRLIEMFAGLLAKTAERVSDTSVTAVVTSCGRHDLLTSTLDSFFDRNSFPLTRMIVVEDGEAEPAGEVRDRFSGQPIDWICTRARVGQIRAIDLAYSLVQTPFIFHLEDDWRFLKPGFIERSMPILLAEPLCFQVWLRGFTEGTSHPIEPGRLWSGDVDWRRVSRDFRTGHYGFSFNPGLRRLRDYQLIGSYGAWVESGLGQGALAELQLSRLYMGAGFFAATLGENERGGYVKHIGRGRHVAGPC